MKSIIWLGALLAMLGILGLAIPVFTTSQTKDVVKLGDLKIPEHRAIYARRPPGVERWRTPLGRRPYRRRALPEALTVKRAYSNPIFMETYG
jgi:hypothetical protein